MKLGNKSTVRNILLALTGELRASSFAAYAGDDAERKKLSARASDAFDAYVQGLPQNLEKSFEDMIELQEDLKEYDLTLTYIVGMLDCIDLMRSLGFLEVYVGMEATAGDGEAKGENRRP